MVELTPTAIDSVFHALADSTRRAILCDVAAGAKSVSDLAQPFAMSLAAVSKHLDVLERSALIRRERKGKQRFVHMNPHPLEAAQVWLSLHQKLWNDRLDRLQTHLEKES